MFYSGGSPVVAYSIPTVWHCHPFFCRWKNRTRLSLVTLAAAFTYCHPKPTDRLSFPFQVGVALLGGFGDLNVDRSAGKGDGAGSSSSALTVQPAELMKMRAAELRRRLKGVGVDLAKHPGAIEKKVCRGVRRCRVCVLLRVWIGEEVFAVVWKVLLLDGLALWSRAVHRREEGTRVGNWGFHVLRMMVT